MSASKHLLSGTGNSPAEKSKFAQTCSRLSLFLKEKGNTIRDLNLGINAKFDASGVPQISPVAEETTADLLSNIDDPKAEKSANIRIPPYIILDSSYELQNPSNKASSSNCKPVVTKPKTAQMTIFYGGQVVVLDDVTPDRARDLMQLANNGQPVDKKPENRVDTSKSKSESPSGEAAKDSDLPIARRASLHKFLAKRKDRATVRAPYQLQNHLSPGGSSSGNDHSFDLNL